MVLEVASRGRIRYRGVFDSTYTVICSSVHFVNAIVGGLVAKTRNIDCHGKPVFRFREITAIYDTEGANSIIEIPLLRCGKTAEYNFRVEDVEGDDNVNNSGNVYARDSDHGQNYDDVGFDEMTILELKASCKKKRKFATSVNSTQRGKNSGHLNNISKGSLHNVQVKEEEPDLEETLSCLKMKLLKNGKVKRKHKAKHACSSSPKSPETGNLKSRIRLSRPLAMQSEPAINGHCMEDTPSLCQLNRIKSENVEIELHGQNEGYTFDSTAMFCNRNHNPGNESSDSLDSPCHLDQIQSENIFYEENTQVSDSSAKFCIRSQSPCNESSSESFDKVDGKKMETGESLSFINEVDEFKVSSAESCGMVDGGELKKGDSTSVENSLRGCDNESSAQLMECDDSSFEQETGVDIEVHYQNEGCVFNSTSTFCIKNQIPCNEPSSESLDSLCQINQIESENMDIELSDQTEARVFYSTLEFCIRNRSPCNESSSESLEKVDGKKMEIGESLPFNYEKDAFNVPSAESRGMADGDELEKGDLISVENSLRDTYSESSAQFIECDDSSLELETGEVIDVVEASTESKTDEPAPSLIAEPNMELALDQQLSAGNPEALTVTSSSNTAICSNHESKPSLQEDSFEMRNSTITQMPDIASDGNLLCTETDDGWFSNSGNNDLDIVNEVSVEEEMPTENIDQDTAPGTSNYFTVDSSAPDAPSQSVLTFSAVADCSQPPGDCSSMTNMLLLSTTTDVLEPPIEVVSTDCSMDAHAFYTSEILTEEQEIEIHSPPENLLSTRQAISPRSQEKLRLAVEADALCDRVQLSKRGKKLSFEKWTKNTTSMAREAAEEAEFRPVSYGPLKKLKYTENGSPPKGILKSSDVSCMISCTCKDCPLIHGRAEKAIAFSQRQMHDIESLAMKLLKGLKSMKSIVEDALDSRECPSTTSKYTADEMRMAADDTTKLEETTRKWLSMMARDCNRFCKIMAKDKEITPNKQQPNMCRKERRKVVFADDIGGILCNVKVFEDDSAPHTA
ncbi:hypothetical protein ACLOJK_002844 [Asimina triloba]